MSLNVITIIRLHRDAGLSVVMRENGDGISYARAAAEGHGKKFVGSAGLAYALSVGTSDAPPDVPLVEGVDFAEVYHYAVGAIQLGGNDDALLHEIAALRSGMLVRFEMVEDRQIERRSGRMVDRLNVVSFTVLEQAPSPIRRNQPGRARAAVSPS